MKIKQITALIIAILLSITVGNTALAMKLNCSTCGCWQEATFLGYVYWDNRFHCEQILCHVCNNVTEWWQTRHEASIAATCTERAYCDICKSYFGNAAGHSWGAWTSDGDGTHTRTCKNDSSHAETQDCSGGTATCVSPAYCDVCNSPYGNTDPNAHDVEHHKAKAATCLEKGWDAYKTCKRDGCNYTTYKEIPALKHEIVKHDAKAPTCTEIGWDAYETCKREGCDYTTRKDIPALNHDIEKHAAKTPTCTEIGWDAYQTCSRCDYTTYQELNALGHDKVHHDAKAATCLEIGWNEYDTCSRCDYTTYAELPALNHNYQNTIVKPTCEADGYTLHTCARCKDTYTDTIVPQRNHWYGEWMPNADSTHSAGCLREGCKHAGKTACQKFDCMVENGRIVFCPVCGNVENGERLELVKKAFATAVTGKLPGGELVARVNQEYLSVAFERAGKLTNPSGKVKVTLPAAVMQGKRLMLIALDGTETELPFEMAGENISFTLDFTEAEFPVMLVRKSL